MQTLKCDSKGRLLLRESLRTRYGDRFIAVPAPGEILLIPVPEDPVTDLREAAKRARGLSTRKLKSVIEETASRQVVR